MPGPPSWQLGGPVVEPEELLVEVDKPELLLELEALELAPLAPEPLALTPELIVELVAAMLCPDAAPSNSDAEVPPSGSVLPPHPSRTDTTKMAAVIAGIRM
jgi:hypothetical protein